MPAEGPIAVDAMGGDGAPQTIVRGALEAVTDSGISVFLVGPQKRLRRELGRFRFLPSGLELVDAPDVVGMNDPAAGVALASIMDKPKDATKVLTDMFAPKEQQGMTAQDINAGAGAPGGPEDIEGGPPPAVQTVLAQMESAGGGAQSVGQF